MVAAVSAACAPRVRAAAQAAALWADENTSVTDWASCVAGKIREFANTKLRTRTYTLMNYKFVFSTCFVQYGFALSSAEP